MKAQPALPYWLIHESGKEHGFAIVDIDSAITAERAVEVWRETTAPSMLALFDAHGTQVEARLMPGRS